MWSLCAALSAGFVLVPSTPTGGHRRLADLSTRGGGTTMMPQGVPKVPYKYPGMESPQWVDVYNRMYRERIMFLGQGIDDDYANMMIAVLLYLESEDANSAVSMYFNVGGGMTKAGLAMYDTMRIMPYDIQTVNMGMAAQVAAFLVAGGTPGKRFALPNARFLMQNPRIDPPMDSEGKARTRIMQAEEMKLEVQETLRDKLRMLEGLSRFTGRSVEVLEQDFKRDFYLSADEASQYGLIDQLLLPKKVASKTDFSFGDFGGTDQRYQGVASGSSELIDGPPAERA